MNTQLRGLDLIKLGYKQGPSISIALDAMINGMKYSTDEERLEVAEDVLVNPEKYREHNLLGKVIEKLGNDIPVGTR